MVSFKENLQGQGKSSSPQLETERLRADRLILKYIKPGEHHGLSEARIGREGPHVFRIIRFFQQVDGDIDKVIEQIGISREAVEAALLYYDRFKEFINARILLGADKPLSLEEFRRLISSQ